MFDDHWYHTSPAPAPEPVPRLRRDNSSRAQSPRPSLERTSQNIQKPRKLAPTPPQAEVLKRPKSQNDLRSLLHAEFLLPQGDAATNTELGDLPPRPKSRNDAHDLKAARYGRGKGARGRRAPLNVASIKDELDFADWYGEFEDQLEDANNDEYRLFHATLDSHLTTCYNLISTTDQTLAILKDLKSSFLTVDSQTSTFQESCSSLLAQQNHLQSLADSVATNLQPFTELEPITRVLARPGSDFVKTQSFREMLVRLDHCLEWMNDPAHRGFKDVESYAPKFRQCMTRALTLIRNFFVSSMREVATEVTEKMKKRQMNDTAQYAKFRINAPLLRDIVDEIEKRCDHEEYISLLDECYSCFASVRQKMVLPIIMKRMQDLSAAGTTTSKDLVAFARSAISFTRSVCLDEFELFYAYFVGERGDTEVYNFLETICEPLYDYIRPKIIHETNLIKLCELCTLLQTRYMRDLEDPDTDPYDRSQLDFGQLIQSTLQDTQNRIVFRATTVIRDEIELFAPKPEDLDYPAKCTRSRRRSSAASGTETPLPNDPVVVEGAFDTETMFTGWYPTLRKCIWLLSKIYRLVNSTVFDDLAHTIVHATTRSLLAASQSLSKSRSDPADSQLFLIRHLLLLKEQLVAFDIEYAHQPDVNIDFSTITGTFSSLRTTGSLFSPNGLFTLVKSAAMPKVITSMLDAKTELDVRLRTAIGDFVDHWRNRMTEGIKGASNRLAAADSPDPAARVKTAVEREVPVLRRKVGEYIDDRRTGETLVGAVMESVVEAYHEYYEEVFVSKGRRPRNPEMAWDGEMFGRWCDSIFDIGEGLLAFEDEDGEGDDGSSRAVSREGSV
ncbi:Sec34-domain-containing protein [Wilcoxina mikolae CBS 423.85]|nr:Sec34-domain-containing protein [Wilcoxina mikolae CBS 423.85]